MVCFSPVGIWCLADVSRVSPSSKSVDYRTSDHKIDATRNKIIQYRQFEYCLYLA